MHEKRGTGRGGTVAKVGGREVLFGLPISKARVSDCRRPRGRADKCQTISPPSPPLFFFLADVAFLNEEWDRWVCVGTDGTGSVRGGRPV